MTMLPVDENNKPIPTMMPAAAGGAHTIAVGAASVKNATPFGAHTRVISLYATVAVRIRLGGAGVIADANAHYIPAATYMHIATNGNMYLAALRAEGVDGSLYISEWE